MTKYNRNYKQTDNNAERILSHHGTPSPHARYPFPKSKSVISKKTSTSTKSMSPPAGPNGTSKKNIPNFNNSTSSSKGNSTTFLKYLPSTPVPLHPHRLLPRRKLRRCCRVQGYPRRLPQNHLPPQRHHQLRVLLRVPATVQAFSGSPRQQTPVRRRV